MENQWCLNKLERRRRRGRGRANQPLLLHFFLPDSHLETNENRVERSGGMPGHLALLCHTIYVSPRSQTKTAYTAFIISLPFLSFFTSLLSSPCFLSFSHLLALFLTIFSNEYCMLLKEQFLRFCLFQNYDLYFKFSP